MNGRKSHPVKDDRADHARLWWRLRLSVTYIAVALLPVVPLLSTDNRGTRTWLWITKVTLPEWLVFATVLPAILLLCFGVLAAIESTGAVPAIVRAAVAVPWILGACVAIVAVVLAIDSSEWGRYAPDSPLGRTRATVWLGASFAFPGLAYFTLGSLVGQIRTGLTPRSLGWSRWLTAAVPTLALTAVAMYLLIG